MSDHPPPDELRVRAEALWEEIGGQLCICQRADVWHWCESCQRKIQLIAEALNPVAPALPAGPVAPPPDFGKLRAEISTVLRQVELTTHRAEALPPYSYLEKPTIADWRERVTWLVDVLKRTSAALEAEHLEHLRLAAKVGEALRGAAHPPQPERVRRLARGFAAEWLRPDAPDHASDVLVTTLTTAMTAFYACARSADDRDATARPPASPPALEALITKWREQSKAKRHIARDDIEDGIWTYQHEAMGASGAHAADADELEAALNALAVPPEAPPR